MGLFDGFKKKEKRVSEEAMRAFRSSEQNVQRVKSRWNEVREVSGSGRDFISAYEDILRGER